MHMVFFQSFSVQNSFICSLLACFEVWCFGVETLTPWRKPGESFCLSDREEGRST